ncbi:hypothetical protein HMPREF0058_1899, partial [Actinomyces urogenitalis DSM 15434]
MPPPGPRLVHRRDDGVARAHLLQRPARLSSLSSESGSRLLPLAGGGPGLVQEVGPQQLGQTIQFRLGNSSQPRGPLGQARVQLRASSRQYTSQDRLAGIRGQPHRRVDVEVDVGVRVRLDEHAHALAARAGASRACAVGSSTACRPRRRV